MSYLLRVQLPDRPGSLGALALALGSVGADIISLDVVERTTGMAVDDLVVEMSPGSLPDTLITAAEKLEGVRVDSIRPYADMLDTHRELELIDQVAMASTDRIQVVVDGAPRVLRVGWATVIALGPNGAYRVAASSGAPESRPAEVPWLPLKRPAMLDGEADWVPELWKDMATSLAAAPLGAKEMALVLGRPGGPEFRPSEVARLGYLAGIIGTILL
ncbi:amino acid-binding protein [Hoyosella rhizosphaerae]|uniref:Amino acid-binding protein n=1 Tax=Hoyosella rhizosphaerae TaxID=1755582 RepID=A0A916TYV0_9ACTN|nr:amino acid-binding protein [Hoyosella rhizosphaerae]MBN4927352.1 amino acid-binding protein [Hoyosella rhizosphaerae]GGC51945.1 amino acid-binding protein [Hoyosella rhizosphaerae]